MSFSSTTAELATASPCGIRGGCQWASSDWNGVFRRVVFVTGSSRSCDGCRARFASWDICSTS